VKEDIDMFKLAERKQSKLRLALIGPSGSGKTYSALLIARGLGGSIAMIDTERGSGELYSHLCRYDVKQLTPPFDPKAYTDAVKEAEDA
jgi:DNA helicase TIP49 (TBP-interacting protein)